MIRKPAGVPDDSEEDRAARRLEEFLRARGLQDEAEADESDETDETDDQATEEEADASGAPTDPEDCPDPAEAGRPSRDAGP
ncbi:hypothetical protein [Streptomyces sp. NPDC051909]|uniref:hypothetical protein n=1 Tax=Streptomyces sp. NPDC051909 TaxID=3154944 RepID=UPI00343594B5